MHPDRLRDVLMPFVTLERRQGRSHQLVEQERRQSPGAGEESTADEAAAMRRQRRPDSPPPGWAVGPGPGLDFDPSVVLRCLSGRNMCLVVSALLCERKVVFVSSRLSLLTQAGEVFR